MSRTTLIHNEPITPEAVPIRPSDRHIDDLPRHAPGVIPVQPRRDVIVIETAGVPSTRVLDPRADGDLAALEFSAELL